jgi:septal ring factor EnvC (AmiA/AmiB activator)
VGDWVLPGETIALTGSSGGQKKTGLYFELRHKGKPMSPLAWITKNKGSG